MQNFVRRKPGIYRGLGFYRQDRREHREKGFLPPRSQRTPRKALPLLKPPAAVGVLGGYSWRPGFLPLRSQRTPRKNTPILETARRSRRARRSLAARVFTAKIAKNAQKKTLPFLKPLGALGVLGGESSVGCKSQSEVI